MKGRYNHYIERIYLENRWRKKKLHRNGDWTIFGLSIYWFGISDYEYRVGFFGITLRIFMVRILKDSEL